jgi:hypothetical protein
MRESYNNHHTTITQVPSTLMEVDTTHHATLKVYIQRHP